jgi:hypothetical protein
MVDIMYDDTNVTYASAADLTIHLPSPNTTLSDGLCLRDGKETIKKDQIDKFLEIAALRQKDTVIEKLESILITGDETFKVIAAALLMILEHGGY